MPRRKKTEVETVARYKFAAIPAIKNIGVADPQKLGEAMQRITFENDGSLTPEMIVEASRDKRSVFNPHIEWDDAVAADGYRIIQARALIRSIRIIADEDGKQTERAFVSIRHDGPSAYRPYGDVRESPSLQSMLIEEADRELVQFIDRHRQHLPDECRIIEDARAMLALKRKKVRPELKEVQILSS